MATYRRGRRHMEDYGPLPDFPCRIALLPSRARRATSASASPPMPTAGGPHHNAVLFGYMPAADLRFAAELLGADYFEI